MSATQIKWAPNNYQNQKLVSDKKMKLNKKNIGTVASEKETSLQLTKFSPDKVNSAVQIFHQNNMEDVKKKQLYTNFRSTWFVQDFNGMAWLIKHQLYTKGRFV